MAVKDCVMSLVLVIDYAKHYKIVGTIERSHLRDLCDNGFSRLVTVELFALLMCTPFRLSALDRGIVPFE